MEALAAPGMAQGMLVWLISAGDALNTLGGFLGGEKGIFCQKKEKIAFPAWEFPPASGFVGQSQPHGCSTLSWIVLGAWTSACLLGSGEGIGNGVPALGFPLSLPWVSLCPCPGFPSVPALGFPLSLPWVSLPGLSQHLAKRAVSRANPCKAKSTFFALLLALSSPGLELWGQPLCPPHPVLAPEPPEPSHNVLSPLTLQHWELLVLEKLKWDLVSVIANDFLPHILHRLPLPADKAELVKKHAQTFIALCATDYTFVMYPPSMIATGSIGAAIHGLSLSLNGFSGEAITELLAGITGTEVVSGHREFQLLGTSLLQIFHGGWDWGGCGVSDLDVSLCHLLRVAPRRESLGWTGRGDGQPGTGMGSRGPFQPQLLWDSVELRCPEWFEEKQGLWDDPKHSPGQGGLGSEPLKWHTKGRICSRPGRW
ncbi:uncharacterized protein LOC107199535 [Parus major]|uniref:uncharacterized protein LOC107199535 n=1 Tax=Parus major TaxID=9157 RepID=UPI000771179C|nr:uncharacterized protein LOC107199535 [Parus major]